MGFELHREEGEGYKHDDWRVYPFRVVSDGPVPREDVAKLIGSFAINGKVAKDIEMFAAHNQNGLVIGIAVEDDPVPDEVAIVPA